MPTTTKTSESSEPRKETPPIGITSPFPSSLLTNSYLTKIEAQELSLRTWFENEKMRVCAPSSQHQTETPKQEPLSGSSEENWQTTLKKELSSYAYTALDILTEKLAR